MAAVSRYQYARTRNRVHRVVIEGGRAFKVENCNLDDVAYLNLVDEMPEGTKCRWCFAGWTEPTTAEEAQAAETPPETMPEGTKAVPLVTSTRRLALAALAAAAILGAALGGMLLSAGGTNAADDRFAAIDELRTRVDDLIVQVRVLSVDVTGHTHEPAAQATAGPPIVVVLPTPAPVGSPETPAEPVVAPTAAPTASAALGAPTTPTEDATTTRIVREVVTVVVVPQIAPTTAPAATPGPVPTCFRPGTAQGVRDRCRWPVDD